MPGPYRRGVCSWCRAIVPLFLLVIIAFTCLPVYALTKQSNSCNSLLNLRFRDALPAEEQQYLGILRKSSFTLKDIQGTLLVIEVFSTYCTSCPRDIPVLNEVYSSVRKERGLRESVRVFSIAIGNTRTEVEGYIKEFRALYPVLTDYNFIAHKALGDPRVPFTLIVRNTAQGRCVIEYTHQGVLSSAEEILRVLKSCIP